jgi:hypothetical protein
MIVSANHLGMAAVGLTLEAEKKTLTIDSLVENLPTREAIAESVFGLMKPGKVWRLPVYRPEESPLFACIDNQVLGRYLFDNSERLMGIERKPMHISIPPVKIAEVLYKLDCLLKEGRLSTGSFIDRVELAFSEERDLERIDGHLIRCLGVVCDRFFDQAGGGISQGVCLWG